jgi:cell division protein FtsW
MKPSIQPIDRVFLGVCVGLSLFGLIILLSASGPVSFQHFSDPLYFTRRQILLGLLPGSVMFYVCSRIDYRKLNRLGFSSLIASFVLLALVFVPGLGSTVGGSASWIKFAGITLQPSEFVKFTFLIYTAAWLAFRGISSEKTLEKSLPFFAALSGIVLLLVLQPDTGTMSIIAMTAMLMYFAAGAPIAWFLGAAAAGVGLLTILIKIAPYRAARFMTFLHPELDPQGLGYHINQAFLAIGSGGLFGLGYGQSRQKYLYLPEVQGDSIFAVMAEEMGFLVTMIFLAAIGFLVYRCIRIAKSAPDAFGAYLAIGVASWIAVQTFANVASMIGLMPITGVTLPFVSYGNSAMVAMFAALGLVAGMTRGMSAEHV